jgi:hypothetical protein
MDEFVRRYNAHGYERFWPPLPSISDPARRGLINEAAFIFFCENFGRSRSEVVADREALLATAFRRSVAYLNLSDERPFSESESRECVAIAGRLETYFYADRMSGSGHMAIGPAFRGCGLVGSCNGDVMKGSTLFEVKAGDRKFRSIDYRQLLIYAALHYSEAREILGRLGVCNPRTGVAVVVPTQTFAYEVSGLNALELFERVLAALSANFVSD